MSNIEKSEALSTTPARKIPNYFTKPGAATLGHMIVNYWLRQGYSGIEVKVIEHIVPRECCEQFERAILYLVRSNIGPTGFPPKTVAA